MQSFYPERFEREMGCTEADWLRWLPHAIGDHFWKLHPNAAGVRIGDGALGLIACSFGQWQGVEGGEHVELTDRQQGRHLSLQFAGDVLVGCNAVGWTDHVGVMRGLVEGQIKLGDWKARLLQDPTLLMEAYLACAQGQGAWSGAQDTRRR